MEWVADDEIGVRKSAFRRCFHIQGKGMVYGTWFSRRQKKIVSESVFPAFAIAPGGPNSVVSPCREPHVSPLPGIQERTDSSAYRDFPRVTGKERAIRTCLWTGWETASWFPRVTVPFP